MLKSFLGDAAQNLLRNAWQGAETRIAEEIAYRTAKYKRKLIKDISSMAIIFLSIIFLAVAFTYLFIEYLSLSVTLSFLITGILLLFIGLIIKVMR